jgi:hypothetical protein
MPELNNRDDYEARIIRRLGGLALLPFILRTLGPDMNLSLLDATFWANIKEKLRSIFTTELDPVFMDTWALHEAQLAYAFPPEILDKWLQRNITQYGDLLAQKVTSTQRAKVEQYVRQYFDNQWTQNELRAKLIPYFGSVRSTMIARTEVTRASWQATDSFGKELGALGIQTTQVWRTREDERVCPQCGPLEDKLQYKDWVLPPPLHVGCRCWTDLVILETA